MKKLLLILFLTGLLQGVNGQIQIEFSAFGENFWGLSAKLRHITPFKANDKYYFVHELGFGHSLPPWNGATASVNFGTFVGMKHFELGFEGSWSFTNPFFTTYPNFGNPPNPPGLFLPQIQYHFGKRRLSYSVSLGWIIPLWIELSQSEPYITEFSSDASFPWPKFSIIYLLREKGEPLLK